MEEELFPKRMEEWNDLFIEKLKLRPKISIKMPIAESVGTKDTIEYIIEFTLENFVNDWGKSISEKYFNCN